VWRKRHKAHIHRLPFAEGEPIGAPERQRGSCPLLPHRCRRRTKGSHGSNLPSGQRPEIRLAPVSCRLVRIKASHLQSRTGVPEVSFRYPAPWGRNSFGLLLRAGGQAALMVDRSTLTPGPIVVVSAMRFRYTPFAPAGFALITASANARIFSSIA